MTRGYDLRTLEAPRALPAGYLPELVEAPGLFRVSGKRLPGVLEALASALDADASPPQDIGWPPAGMDESRASALMDAWELLSRGHAAGIEPPSDAERAAIQHHRESRASSRRVSRARPNAVPRYKLESGDDWILTPSECMLLAAPLRTAGDPYLARLAVFLVVAADAGGCRVREG